MAAETIRDLSVATVRAALPEPILFGDWVMRHRSFAVVRLTASSGAEGFAFTLTREGPVDATIRQAIAHHYVGATFESTADAAAAFDRRSRRSRPARPQRGDVDRALSRR